MKKEIHRWYSDRLGRDMTVNVYGHYGLPILVFPDVSGNCDDFERFQMLDTAASFIESGKIKLYCVDSIDHETWCNPVADDHFIDQRHTAFHRYITDEVVLFIYDNCHGKQPIFTLGCGLGAFHAANFFFREPDIFDGTLSLSGTYDVKTILQRNYQDEQLYFNSPLDYLRNISDSWYISRYRLGTIIISACQGPDEQLSLTETKQMSAILHDLGIEHWCDIWGHESQPNWFWWRKQLAHFLPCIV
ncbi:MAG: esterase family protein [Aestuariibacter sp.]